jgi:hypothetical protein
VNSPRLQQTFRPALKFTGASLGQSLTHSLTLPPNSCSSLSPTSKVTVLSSAFATINVSYINSSCACMHKCATNKPSIFKLTYLGHSLAFPISKEVVTICHQKVVVSMTFAFRSKQSYAQLH